MTKSTKLFFLLALLVFLAYGEVNSPIEAQGELSSVEGAPVFITPSHKTSRTLFTIITGYSSSVNETDDTPWLTAAGTRTRDGIIASNFLPMGTKVKIPRLFGDKIFIVEDRLNNRFFDRVDIWFPSKSAAKHFGIHYNTLIQILD
ncbi:MAG: hypothetical protein AAB371_00475 [Patescibacteria group bacterium]